jgi:formylglycine-generating enzyme required for sulfatase activity
VNIEMLRNIEVVASIILAVFCLNSCQSNDNNGSEIGPGIPQSIVTSSGIEMVLLPGGFLKMGSEKGSLDEIPVHKVWIDTFLMDKFEVTQDMFRQFEISDPSYFQGEGLPAEQLTWIDAARFCNERSYIEGLDPCYDEDTWKCDFEADGYRLPSEAEWEYACRAGTNSEYFFGSDPGKLKQFGWFENNALEKTHQIGTRDPNHWGLYDMYGNVAEWCNDYFDEEYYQNSPQENPHGPEQGELRVIRGGAWNSSDQSCRSTYRTGSASVDDGCMVSNAVGFRCVRNAPVPDNKNATKTNKPILVHY